MGNSQLVTTYRVQLLVKMLVTMVEKMATTMQMVRFYANENEVL